MLRRLLVAFGVTVTVAGAQQPVDAAYTAKISDLTPTDPRRP